MTDMMKVNKTNINRLLFSLVLLVMILASLKEKANMRQPPNILLIVSEDNGPDLGCYGVKEVTTPHLDKLADESVRFQNAFTTYSVCSPSRSTIFTGLYPHQNGQIGLATHKYRMYENFKTMPVFLKEAGYRTGCVGKIHVNPEAAIPFDFHPLKGSNFAKKDLPRYAKEAAAFMKASEDPFFLMVNYPDAHFPLQQQVEGMPAHPLDSKDIEATLPFVGADSERLREFTANYYNSMNRLDEAVGMLLDALKASGKADNTLIIYLGDHGAQFSRGKCSNYEAGLRIPLIMHWPGKMKKAQVREELVSTLDLLPTVLEAADIDIPENLPGFSLLPLVKGKKANAWRKYLFADGEGSTAMLYYPRRSVRDERYKLIANLLSERENPKFTFYARHHNQHFAAGTTLEEIDKADPRVQAAYAIWKNPPAYELYDLENDPHEFRNLSANPEYQKNLERLKQALHTWQAATHDPLADPETFARFTAEVDSVNKYFPEHSYAKNPAFQWRYPAYFYKSTEP